MVEEQQWVMCPHKGPHLDEAAASMQLRMFGTEKYPGINSASVRPCKLNGTEEENIAMRRMPIGQLGGKYDDKDPVTGVRRPDTCCALETAKDLGIHGRPDLKPFFRAVLRVDTSTTAVRSDLSVLMKDANNTFPESMQSRIFEWAEKGVYNIIKFLIEEFKAQAQGKTLYRDDYIKPLEVFEKRAIEQKIREQQVLYRIKRALMNSEKNNRSCVELSFVMMAMKALNVPEEEVIDWVVFCLDNMVKKERDYLLAIKEIAEKGEEYQIPGTDNWVLFVDSDNRQITYASRSNDNCFAACIVRNSNGGVVISTNAKIVEDVSGVRALIRVLELNPDQRKEASYEDCSLPGVHKLVSHWYCMDKNGSIMNRPDPGDGITATKLPKFALVQAVIGGINCPETFFEQATGVKVEVKQKPQDFCMSEYYNDEESCCSTEAELSKVVDKSVIVP